MRKFLTIIFTTILVSISVIPVCASDGAFNTAHDLFVYWEENDAYPDYVCGVWSNDGGIYDLTISVLDNEVGETGKREILDLIKDDDSVSFEYGKYSRNYLIRVQNEEISQYFKKGVGLAWVGFIDTKNGLTLGILEEKKDDPATLEWIEEMKKEFGDIFYIEYTDGYVKTLALDDSYIFLPSVDDISLNLRYDVEKPKFEVDAFFIAMLGAAVILAGGILALMYRRSVVLSTNTGRAVTAVSRLSNKEIEKLIKKSDMSFPTQLDSRVMGDISSEK
ncbi:MAG: hypothetical protein E7672_00400 [Ruminococcaceae bacterium]|nr:hypothetical protein [Oscillospiraceae bacterium]